MKLFFQPWPAHLGERVKYGCSNLKVRTHNVNKICIYLSGSYEKAGFVAQIYNRLSRYYTRDIGDEKDMDPTSLATLIQSFQDMAKSNQEMAKQNAELVAAVQKTTEERTTPAADPPTTDNDATANTTGAVALTAIKVPLTLGDSAEERLINFHEWKEDVHDKFTVAGVTDTRRQTTIALMWGGKDIKTYAIEKAGVIAKRQHNQRRSVGRGNQEDREEDGRGYKRGVRSVQVPTK